MSLLPAAILGRGRRLPSRPAVAVVVIVAGVIGMAIGNTPVLSVAVVGVVALIGLLALAWNRPDIALLGLVLLLPFYPLMLAKLFIIGWPSSVLAPFRFWKEVIVVVVLLKAVHDRPQLDPVDRVALAYLLVMVFFTVMPIGRSTIVRVTAFRDDGFFILLFLAAKHVALPRPLDKRLVSILLVAGTAVSIGAFWNHFWPDSWVNWINQTGLVSYQSVALGASILPPVVREKVAGHLFIRAGSIFLNPLSMPYYVMIPLALSIAAGIRGRARHLHLVAAALCVGAVLLSLTRSALVVLPLLPALAMIATRKRVRVGVVLIVGAAAILVLATQFGLGESLNAAADPSNASNAVHISRLQQSVQLIVDSPLGYGMGTAGSSTIRYSTGGITNHDAYFHIGTEMGVLGMGLFIAFIVLTLAQLWRAAKGGNQLALAAVCALAAVALGGLVLETFNDISLDWTVFLLAGLALSKTAQAPEDAAQGPAASRMSTLRPLSRPFSTAPASTGP